MTYIDFKITHIVKMTYKFLWQNQWHPKVMKRYNI